MSKKLWYFISADFHSLGYNLIPPSLSGYLCSNWPRKWKLCINLGSKLLGAQLMSSGNLYSLSIHHTWLANRFFSKYFPGVFVYNFSKVFLQTILFISFVPSDLFFGNNVTPP